MRIVLILLVGFSINGYSQNYPAFELSDGYFINSNSLNGCVINLNIKKDKSERINNYNKAKAYSDSNLIFIHITGSKTHNPITPCRIVPDSSKKYGYYFATLAELNTVENSNECKNTWIPMLDNMNFKIFKKECFDEIVNKFNREKGIKE